MSFGDATAADGLVVGTGTVPIGVTPENDNSTIVASFHVPLIETTRAFAVAAGAFVPANGQPFRLLVVDTSASPWTASMLAPITP